MRAPRAESSASNLAFGREQKHLPRTESGCALTRTNVLAFDEPGKRLWPSRKRLVTANHDRPTVSEQGTKPGRGRITVRRKIYGANTMARPPELWRTGQPAIN